MPSFTLKKSARNLAIAEALRNAYDVKVSVMDDLIQVTFEGGITFSSLDLNAAIATEEHWRSFMKEIRRTLSGAKIREFNKLIIGISPLRTRRLLIRLSPSEKRLLVEAAKISGTTVTDFARTAILNAVDDAFNEETIKIMNKRAHEEKEKAETYVS